MGLNRSVAVNNSISEGDTNHQKPTGHVRGSTSTTICEECLPFDDIDIARKYEDNVINAVDTSNTPHSMLELPLLYRLCQFCCPRVLEMSKAYYAMRWGLSYPLQHKVTYSFALAKMGFIASWGEALLIIPFFSALVVGILFSLVFPSVQISGKVARAGLIAALVFAQRANSIITFLIGMPVDRALYYHKLAGRLAGVASSLHLIAFFLDDSSSGLFANTCNASGSVMMLIIIGMIVTSVPGVRYYLYEAFYFIHIVGGVGLVVGAFFHSGSLVPTLAIFTWGADSLMRYLSTTRHSRGTQLTQISESVVELQFPKTFDYNPGQYVYVKIPSLSRFQWHPFSICSAPCQSGFVTLRIRNNGDWTARMFSLSSSPEILVQGPYGNLGIDIMDDDRKYKDIILIGGGIGVTPMQSVLDQLMFEVRLGRRELRSLTFVWVERDGQLLCRLYEDYLQTLEKMVDLRLHCTGSTHSHMLPHSIRRGRPEMAQIFEREITGKVAVLCSASPKFMDACREACLWYTSDTVRYDFHSEAMAI